MMRDRLLAYGLALLFVMQVGCFGSSRPPGPSPIFVSVWTRNCALLYGEELGRAPAPIEADLCLRDAIAHSAIEETRGRIRASAEWQDRHRPPPPPALAPLTVDGRHFTAEGVTVRLVFADLLAALARTPEEQTARLGELAALGFNGVRVFAGDLGWAGQTPESARAALPGFVARAAAARLYVEVTAITGCGTGYDYEAHLREVAGIVQAHANAILEVANEPYHPTQCRDTQEFDRLAALAARAVPAGVVYALGAPPYDEPENGDSWPMPVGPFVTVHLDRSRPKWEQVRRVRELENVSAVTGRPVLNNEPIGAAEAPDPGRRETDPAFFYALGALDRLFEVGGVFHSEDGLNARALGPNQTACADAFVAGGRAIQTDARLTFKNASWGDSPVKGWSGPIVRAYSGISGNEGYTVLVGVEDGAVIEWQNGWREDGVVGERPGVRVLRIRRD